MPVISPGIRFWLGVAVTVAIGVSSGTLVLTNAIPDGMIKPFTAWCGIIAFIGSAVQTALQGVGTSTQNRLAAAASIPEVSKIVTSPEMAHAAPSEKVVPK